MNKTSALIFGFNQYALEIESNVTAEYDRVQIFSLHKEDVENKEKNIEHFDLSEEWTHIEENINIENSIAFCALENSAENIFLTISLRAYFKDLTIIAIASNKEGANKLIMAGANKVIPLVETTADIIANVLEKPISNKVLHSILYEESKLKVEQIEILDAEFFNNVPILDIDWSRYKGIIILSIMHEDMSHEYIYASKLKHYIIKKGDILVVAGFIEDINEFKKLIGSK